MLVVGYNSTGDGYWIIKNSRGTTWGEQGYMRLAFSNDCGLVLRVTYINYTVYYINPKTTVDVGTHDEGLEAWQIVLIVAGVLLHPPRLPPLLPLLSPLSSILSEEGETAKEKTSTSRRLSRLCPWSQVSASSRTRLVHLRNHLRNHLRKSISLRHQERKSRPL